MPIIEDISIGDTYESITYTLFMVIEASFNTTKRIERFFIKVNNDQTVGISQPPKITHH